MIAQPDCFDDDSPDLPVAFRAAPTATRQWIVLAERLDVPRRQKLANQARFHRGRTRATFSGLHRRRDKRSIL